MPERNLSKVASSSSSTVASSGKSTDASTGAHASTGTQTNSLMSKRLQHLLDPLKGKVAFAHTSTLNLILLLTNDINPSLNAITGKSSQLANNKTIMNIKNFFKLLTESLTEIIDYKLDFVNQKLGIFKKELEFNTKEQKIKANMQEDFIKKLGDILEREQEDQRSALGAALKTNRTLSNRLIASIRKSGGGSSPQISHIKIFQSEFKKILIKLDNISEDISLSVSNKNKKIKKVIKEYKKITLKHIKILKKEQLKLSSKKIIKRPKKSIKKSTKKQMKKSIKKQMKKSTKKQIKKSTKKK